MQNQLKELNKILQKNLVPRAPKNKFRPIFKNFIVLTLVVIMPLFWILFSPHIKTLMRREIIITAQGQTMGMIFSSLLKNKDQVNLLILGIPGKGYQGENLTDTIILLNSTPKGENPIGISVPRDLLVKYPGQSYYTKINAIYGSSEDKWKGMESMKSTLKEITDLDIDYFIVFDLKLVKNIIDQFDGIDVVVEKDIYDTKFPAPYDSYETFSLSRGVHHLDGETALKYIRSRNTPEGDFSRIKRQQQVIDILKNKILSLNFFWDFPAILKLWKSFSNNTYTNIDITDIKYVWNLISKGNLDTINFATIGNEENQLLVPGQILLDGQQAYVLEPKAGLENYQEIKEYIKSLIKQ